MKIVNLTTNQLNQNGYNLNHLTKNKIGFLYTAPVNLTPEDCLACDGYVLKIEDYNDLYSVIGKTFNTGDESSEEFRIPDYNITGEFLQPNPTAGKKIAAGVPNITGSFMALSRHSYHNNNYLTGALYSLQSNVTTHNIGNGGTVGYFDKIGFNAGRSNSIFGKSNGVQPPSMTVKIYIKYK